MNCPYSVHNSGSCALKATNGVSRDTYIVLQMGVLLARSENQVLVLETLLKRLVQVCVHTQDKRLAKELKLMDFTRLVRTAPLVYSRAYVALLLARERICAPASSGACLVAADVASSDDVPSVQLICFERCYL